MPDLDPLSEIIQGSRDPNRQALADPRVKGFLDKIGKSEGADYNTLVGGSKINDLSRHPNRVGLTTSAGPSTAFGKYQIVGSTDRSKLRKYRGLDYSPENQDLRAVELLRQTGALDALMNDDEPTAIKLAGREWASLPGSSLPGRKNFAAFKTRDPLTEITQAKTLNRRPSQPESNVDPLTEITQQPHGQVSSNPFAGVRGGARGQRPSKAVGMIPGMSAMRQVAKPLNRENALEIEGKVGPQSEAEIARGALRGVARLGNLPTQFDNPVSDWINEAVAKGGAGLMRQGAGLVRSIPHDPLAGPNQITDQAANKINAGADTLSQATGAIDREANRGVISQTAQDVVGGGISSAPAMVLTSLGVPAPVAFGVQSYLEAEGRNADWKDVLKETGLGAATGALFEIPLPARMALLAQIGAKLGIVGGGTYGIEKLVGMPESEARKNAIVNALFGASGVRRAPAARAPVQTVPEPLQARLRMGEIRDQAAQQGAELLNPTEVVAGAKPKVRLNAKQTEAQPNITAQPESAQSAQVATMGTSGGGTPTSSVEIPRHVDLLPRRARNTESGKAGQFKKETRAQREERLAQVNPPETPPSESASVSPVEAAQPVKAAAASLPAEPSTTSARRSQMASDRAELDLPELPPAERKSWRTSLGNAKPEKAGILADEVLTKPRALNDEETASLVVRAQEIKNEHSTVLKEIGDATDPDVISAKRSQAEALEREFDKLTTATKASGTEKGRALASQKLTINQDFDLVSVLQRAKAAKGRELNAQERAKYEGMVKQVDELQTKLAKVEADAQARSIQKDIERLRRQTRRGEKKQALDEEFSFLKTEFAQARMEVKGVQPSGLAGLDPEGKLTPIILKMARNRVKAGVVEAEAVIDHVYNAVREHVENVSRDDIKALLAGHNLDRDPLPAIKTRLRKQEADLTRRIAEKDYSEPPKRKPVVYDREASNLKAQVEGLKRKVEAEIRGNDSRLETILALRKAGMLTGIRTHLRNIGGNTAFQAFEEVSRMPGSVADLLVSTVTKRRALGVSNPVDVAKSSYSAATKGVREAIQIMKYGATAEDLAKFERPREMNSGSKILDAYANTVFRSLGAEDKVFRTYAYERSMLDQKRLLKTDKVTPAMEAQAILDAEVATFNNKNQLAQGITWLQKQTGPVGSTAIDLVLPFKQTPANIASRLMESTPLGLARGGGQLLKAAINKEMPFEQQRQFSQTIGRSVTGSGLILLGYYLASKGLATGLSENDPGDREVQKASGRSPLAVKIGDKWHQIGAFSPIGNLIAIGAALHRERTRPLKEGEERGNVVTSAGPVASKVLLEQPFLKGASGIVDALQNPGRRGSALVGQTFGSFIPTVVSDAGAAIDNKRREKRGVVASVEDRIPIIRARLPEDKDVFARPLQSSRTAMIDPTLTSADRNDPFLKELTRLDVGVPKSHRLPEESDEQYRKRLDMQGKAMADELAKTVDTRSYRMATDEGKTKLIKDTIEKVRHGVNEWIKYEGKRQHRGPRQPRSAPYRYVPTP